MTEYQSRRINQLTDILVRQRITKSEYIEYQYLTDLMASDTSRQRAHAQRQKPPGDLIATL